MTFFRIFLHQSAVQDHTETISNDIYLFDAKELGRKQRSEVTIAMAFEWSLRGEPNDLVLHGLNS